MSEQLTDTRRAALREQGIFPRSSDFSSLFAVCGALLGYKYLGFELNREYKFKDILALTFGIPFGAALGALVATLSQSKFLIKPTRGNLRRGRGSSDFFYSLVKFFIIACVLALTFRRLQSDVSVNDDAKDLWSLVTPSISACMALLIFFALVDVLLSRLVFNLTHKMTKSEVSAEDNEGEMRPEMRAATERFSGEDS